MKQTVERVSAISGTIRVPGDKSISHRAIMLGSISNGITEVEGFLNAEDCLSTISVFRSLGVKITSNGTYSYIIHGKGLYGLEEPQKSLYVGNSGTTIRLTSGILAAQKFNSVITGDASIERRPMGRIVDPLKLMGAKIDGKENGKYAPLHIQGTELTSIDYKMPIASAQVKSALILAGLYADGTTNIFEKELTRDHTEKMLTQFGGAIEQLGAAIKVFPNPKLEGQKVLIPTDFSSAAFFIAAALIVPNSDLIVKEVGINETRIGFLDALRQMNGNIEILNKKYYGEEPVADIRVKTSQLNGTEISREWIPRIIDELPLLAVVASQAEGTTTVKDAAELRVKETDRIKTISSELTKLGVKIEEFSDGFMIKGKQQILGGIVNSHGDHRIGMAMAIAGLIAKEKVEIENTNAISISYPSFFKDLETIVKS